jgi:uncharacterized protein with HEPN domain
MRDKVMHGYFGVNTQIVWKAARQDAPLLKPLFARIVEEETHNGDRDST